MVGEVKRRSMRQVQITLGKAMFIKYHLTLVMLARPK